MGQSRLMHAYEREFEAVKRETAQILLTSEDIRSRARYLNIRNTIFTLWSFGVVPIVNENDTVSFAEIRFGDNDIISAHIANMLDADLLVMLTDTDGVYDMNPKHARRRARPADGGEGDGRGPRRRGGQGVDRSPPAGMESKIRAADIATRSGVGVVIARGDGLDLAGILAGGEIGTWFVPADRRMKGRKKWMAFNPADRGGHRGGPGRRAGHPPPGTLAPARRVKGIRGAFAMGSVISILDEDGSEVARGLQQFLQRGAREDPRAEHEEDPRGAGRRGGFRRGGAPGQPGGGRREGE